MPDKDDDVVNVDLDPEDALVILLETDLRDAPEDPQNPSPVIPRPHPAPVEEDRT